MGSNSKPILGLLLGAAALLASVWPAASADFGSQPSPVAPASQWQFNFTPYGWVTWLQGAQAVRARTVEVDVDPIELIEHLESVPFMGYAEARKGPLGFYGDIVYANLGLDADGVRSRSQHPLINGTISASLGLDIEMTILEAGGAYEIAKWPSGGGSNTAIDLYAGARYWHQDADIKLAVEANLDIRDLVISRGIALARSGSVDWVDPLVGAGLCPEGEAADYFPEAPFRSPLVTQNELYSKSARPRLLPVCPLSHSPCYQLHLSNAQCFSHHIEM
jgi:hypothetical protein